MGFFNKFFKKEDILKAPKLEGEKGIKEVGHRKYVGGMWDEIGPLQFRFLVNQGLKPNNILLDIACGSLRAGVHFIPYLDKGNYLGIEKESKLVELGKSKELSASILKDRSPEFVISRNFEFSKFSKSADFAIAQSLFTHLPTSLINLCLSNLKDYFSPKGKFYATYFISDEKWDNPKLPHDHDVFRYTKEEVLEFGTKNGWHATYIGDWNHPRGQKMVMYTPKDE